MTIELLTKGDAGYEENRVAYNLALDQRPAAIAVPRTPADVAEAVRRAKAAGLRPRGHLPCEPPGPSGRRTPTDRRRGMSDGAPQGLVVRRPGEGEAFWTVGAPLTAKEAGDDA